MSKDKKNRDTKLKEGNLQIRTPYIVAIKDGCDFTGILAAKCESLKGDSTCMFYRFYLGGTKCIDLYDNEIEHIYEIQACDYDSQKYFQEFEEEYGIKCFNNDGELLDSTVILGNILYNNEGNIWNDLTAEQKEELVNQLVLNTDDIIKLLDAFSANKQENKKLHDKNKEIMNATLEVMENYNRVSRRLPSFEKIYELFFDTIGMKQFVDKICSQ